MTRSDKNAIAQILTVNEHIGELECEIEKEQEVIIKDLVSPAEKVVKALMALDGRRLDLCDIHVLYGLIERGLGAEFGVFCACAGSGCDCGLYEKALKCIAAVGFDAARLKKQFGYLFKRFKQVKKPVAGEALTSAQLTPSAF